MGAGTGDIMRLLRWQFTKPVLWDNLIAWPSAGFLMSRWSVHCWLVARAKPVTALQYI
jgi:hypothetical protein